jgi:hypothetical protein
LRINNRPVLAFFRIKPSLSAPHPGKIGTGLAITLPGRITIIPRGLLVGKLLVAAALLAVSMTACKKTESGDLEVEKPVVGTVTDTVNVPKVEVGTETTNVAVPKMEVKKDTVGIKTPTVKVKR